MNKKNKYLALIILLLAVSIGFAAIQTTLKINGTTTVNKHEWNIYWGAPTVTEGSVSMTATSINSMQQTKHIQYTDGSHYCYVYADGTIGCD